jgi:hypothetical protein
MSYEGEKSREAKISNFLRVAGLINTIFKPSRVQKHTGMPSSTITFTWE